jgi:hypothetical protein
MFGTYLAAKIHHDIRARSKGIYCQFAKFSAILLRFKGNFAENHNFATVCRINHNCNVWALTLFFKVIMRECFVSASCNEY